MKVYSALLVLTVVTVGVSHLGLPPTLSIITAMAVASVKAFLVSAWFMHLIHDTKFNVLFFVAALWFIGVFFGFVGLDLMFRDRVMKAQDTIEFRKDRAEDFKAAGGLK